MKPIPVLLDPPLWMDQAACASHPIADLWFPSEFSSSGQLAIEVCKTCRVRLTCLNYALETEQTEGVWGGLLPAQRMKLGGKREA